MVRKIYLIISFVVLLTFSAHAQVDKTILESHFRSGNAPGQSEFQDLINSCYNYSVAKGLIYEPGTNSLRAEVPLDLLEGMLADSKQEFNGKLIRLENALHDSTRALRQSMKLIEDRLTIKNEDDHKQVLLLISDLKELVFAKIDFLTSDQLVIKEKHQVLKGIVEKMKIKLDILNYTEHNFTQTLKLKLDNIEDGATRSDNNLTDALVVKLLAIENNANNYQLPMSSHAKLGGIKLSQDFILNNGKVYSALDPEKIDRWYATDLILNDWTNVLGTGQRWTKVRMKIPKGVDAHGNKTYDYGEFNPPYKFIYDDLETNYYEYNGTDESNVILGEHEKQKKITGVKNTLIGHKAGYNLFSGGDENVIIGFEAGQSSANVSHNVFVGSRAGQSIQGGSANVGQMNVAVGSHAMSGRNNNKESLALGYASMALGEQESSTAIGTKAMKNNSGENNIAIGYEAAFSAGGSNNKQNINLGYRSAYSTMTAQRNIGIGDSTAFSNISGKGNLFIGHGSGKTNTLSGNLFIGHGIDEAGSNKMLIGNNGKVLISGDFTSGLVKIDKLSSSEIKIGESKIVIDNTAQFVGEGGVNTNTVNASSQLSAAGVEIIKKEGTLLTERYAQKTHRHVGSDFVTDATHRFVSDSEKTKWNKGYGHPSSHPASMITTDANKQFVSETEKSKWTAGNIPIGGIIMWSGATIPVGWALCDGSTKNGKSTPDLRGRFIVGSYPGKSGYNIGKSGGTVGNMGQTSEDGDHSHSGKTNTYKLTSRDMPLHRHSMLHRHKINAKKGVQYRSTKPEDSNPGGAGRGGRRTMNNKPDTNFFTGIASSDYTGYAGRSSANQNQHAHSIYADGEHSHTLPYYALAFIMRVK